MRSFCGAIIGSMVLTLALGRGSVSGQDLTGLAGAFPNIPITARWAALQNPSGSLCDPITATYLNPAAVVQTSGREVGFSYSRLFGLVPVLSAAGALPLGPRAGFGLAFTSSGDELYREHTVRASAGRIGIVLGRQVDVGVAAALHYATYGSKDLQPRGVSGDALGGSLDIGTRLWLTPETAITLVMQRALSYLRWNSSGRGRYMEGLPPFLAAGISVVRPSRLQLGIDLEKSLTRDAANRLYLFGERELSGLVVLRASYATQTSGEPTACWALGFGLKQELPGLGKMQMDIAYIVHPMPNTLGVTFGLGLPPTSK
ncbi:MAG: hypothetical protein ONB23_08010 [candidate division KSB1 bacterium]|nr:hypothetical protein [candidate division KSB1 bacterium]